MRKFLMNLIAKKNTRAAEIKNQISTAQTADEVRSLGDELRSIEAEIAEAQAKLDELPADDVRSAGVPANAELRGGVPLASYAQATTPEKRSESPLDSMEYRKAFAKYVQTGEWTYRADEIVTTDDVGKIIPNTIMQEFIKQTGVYGQLFSRVRKMNVKGGVEFPLEDLIPTVTWITETTTSETQKAPEIKASISFGYHIVEARIAQTLLSQVVSLAYLEQEIARLLAEAFVKEFDRVCVKGSGNGQPLGMINDTRVPTANKIKFTAEEVADWTSFRKKLFAKIPLKYRGQGVLVMTAGTWESNIMTLKDSNNNPLYSETYNATSGQMECRFNGREVILVEPDILADFDTAATGDVWCIYFRPQDYGVNTNLQLGFKRYFDDNTNKWINKGLCIMDGKLIDASGCYLLTK